MLPFTLRLCSGFLVRRKQQRQHSPFHRWSLLDNRYVAQFLRHAFQHFQPNFLMENLTTAEPQIELDLVAIEQETPRLFGFDIKIVFIGFRFQADLLDIHLLLVFPRLALFLRLLVAEFAVIQNATDGRDGVRRDFNQIKPAFFRHQQGIADWDNADLCAILVNQAHFASANAIVDTKPVSNCSAPFDV